MATYKAQKLGSKWKPAPKATLPKAPKVLQTGSAKFGPAKVTPVAPTAKTWQPISGFTAPPAPSAPAAPSAQAQPFDKWAEDQEALANNQYNATLAGINFQQGQVKRQYGFDDPSDPFNAMAMLTRAYQQGQRRTLNTAGNVYSSAHLRNTDANRFQYMQSESDLRTKYQEALHALEQQRAQAGVDRDTAVGNARLAALERAPRPEDPGPPPGSPGAASAAPPPQRVAVAKFSPPKIKTVAPAKSTWGKLPKKKGKK